MKRWPSLLPLDFFYTVIFLSSLWIFVFILFLINETAHELTLPFMVLASTFSLMIYFWWQKNSREGE